MELKNVQIDTRRCFDTSGIELIIGMASNQYTQEIVTNTSNLHLTSRVRVQLDSYLQGHFKVLCRLTRGIERANHHTELLSSAIDTKRPPRVLIPKVTPKIPDYTEIYNLNLNLFRKEQLCDRFCKKKVKEIKMSHLVYYCLYATWV